MTETAPGQTSGRPQLLATAEHGAAALAILIWILLLLPDSGGFHSRHTAVQALALLPLLLLSRPWMHAPAALLGLIVLAAGGVAVTALATEVGWIQGNTPAGQIVGLLTLVGVLSYARSPSRRMLVVAPILVLTVIQFARGWLAWWGSGDPNRLMVATFFWHNQLAAFLGALALLGAAIAVLGAQPLRRPALLVAPLAAAGVVLTTSRAALFLLIAGWVALLALAFQSRRRLIVALALPVLTAVTLLAFTSPLFFPDRAWEGPPLLTSATAEESSGGRGGETLDDNGADRVDWTVAALRSFADSPVVGNGFGSFAETSGPLLPERATLSPFVHNGYADALTSGGLLFGGPMLAISIMLGLRSLRALRATDERGITVGAALATLFLLGHSLVDFDWHYPSLVILLGICGGLLPNPVRRAAPPLLALGLVFAVGIAVSGSLLEHEERSKAAAATER